MSYIAATMAGQGTHARAIDAWFGHFFDASPTRTFRPLSISVANLFDFVGANVMAVQWDNRPVNKAGEDLPRREHHGLSLAVEAHLAQ